MRGPALTLPKITYWLVVLAFITFAHSSAADSEPIIDAEAPALAGQWRGVLEIQDGIYLALGVNISAAGMTLDSPNQGMFEHAVTEFAVSAQEISFVAESLGARYEGTLKDGVLMGTFHQARALPLNLYRLSEDDQARMQYEGTYQGNLTVNAQTSLPLRLNIAVLHAQSPHGAYLATLDSPLQQSFGLPVSNLEIDPTALSFESPMLGASYVGEGRDGDYMGTFTQGAAHQLRLQKVSTETPLEEVASAESGAHGAALASLTRNSAGDIHVEQVFYQDHDAHTQYEIGSVTKTMVAYLLASLADEGVISEQDQVSDWYAEADETMTLASLATHHSGLPRLPENLFDEANPEDPYAHYNDQHLRAALSNSVLEAPDYAYSNYAFGLLGEVLAKAADMTFAELMEARLFAPLGMENSVVALPTEAKSEHFSQGYNNLGQAAGAWHFSALAGAGGVVADLPDMVTYTQSMMDIAAEQNELATRLFAPRESISDCCDQALGWILQADPEGKMTAWHSGQTGGFSAFVGFYLDGSAGLVWLNAQSVEHTNDMRDALWALSD